MRSLTSFHDRDHESLQLASDHVSYGLRCLNLHGIGHVGVGPQGEAWVGMAQHAADRSDVYAALQGNGCSANSDCNSFHALMKS